MQHTNLRGKSYQEINFAARTNYVDPYSKNSNGNIEYKLMKGLKFEGTEIRGVKFAKYSEVVYAEFV